MDPALKQRLDAFVSGESSADLLVQELTLLCDATPDSAWEVLSLTDQYFRRGKVSREVLRSLRTRVIPHLLGAAPAPVQGSEPPPAVAPVSSRAPVRLEPSRIPPLPQDAAAAELRSSPAENPDQAPLQREIDALQRELDSLRRAGDRNRAALARYRHRIAVLARYGRRARAALTTAARGPPALPRGTERRWMGWPTIGCALLGLGLGVPLGLALAKRESGHAAAVHAAAGRTPGSAPLEASGAAHPAEIGTATQVAEPRAAGTRHDATRIGLAADRFVVYPGQAHARIEVRREGGSAAAASLVWWTQGGGAKPGRDYVAVRPKTLVIPAGSSEAQLEVAILGDPARRHTELFYVVIAKPGEGTTLGAIKRAAVFLLPRP